MKRTLALAITGAAFLGAAGPASAAVQATSTAPVTADVAPTLEATFPAALTWGALNATAGSAGNTSDQQDLKVWSNEQWGVTTWTDKADGKMVEADGAGDYVTATPKILDQPLQWRLSSLAGSPRDLATDGFKPYTDTATVMGASNQPATTDAGTALGVTYKQVIKYSDVAAGDINDYKIVVNYDFKHGY
jgi:hypothetical protein